jgi:predicted TIM-barrel fold metal-dependent hydrolase
VYSLESGRVGVAIGRLVELGGRATASCVGWRGHLNRFGIEASRPWIEHCLNTFGDLRCFFASKNFPVDGIFGSYDELCTLCDQHTRRFERVYNF